MPDFPTLAKLADDLESGRTSCTKIIADTLTFTGTSNLQVNCTALGTATIGSQTAQLIE